MNHEHLFSFGHLAFLDTYAVITINDSKHIDFTEINEIGPVLESEYIGKQFGLIANRVNQYSVNPLAINKLFSVNNLVAGAIVSQSSIAQSNAIIENDIVEDAPIKYFHEMSSAITWINEKVLS